MELEEIIAGLADLRAQATSFAATLGAMEVAFEKLRDGLAAGDSAPPGQGTEEMAAARPEVDWKGTVQEYLEAQKAAHPDFDGPAALKLFQASQNFGKFATWTGEEWRAAYDHLRAAILAKEALPADPRAEDGIGPEDWAAFEDLYQDRLEEAAGFLHHKYGRKDQRLDYPGISKAALKDVMDGLAAFVSESHHPDHARAVWGWMKKAEEKYRYDLRSQWYKVQQEGDALGGMFPAEFNDWNEQQAAYMLGRLRAVLYGVGKIDTGDADHLPDNLRTLKEYLLVDLENSIKVQGLAPADGKISNDLLRAELRAIHELDPGRYKAILSLKDCKDADLIKLYIVAARDRIGAAAL